MTLRPILASLVESSRHHLICPDADLEYDLKLDALHRAYCLPQAILEATGREIDGGTIEAWRTVGDVMASMEVK